MITTFITIIDFYITVTIGLVSLLIFTILHIKIIPKVYERSAKKYIEDRTRRQEYLIKKLFEQKIKNTLFS